MFAEAWPRTACTCLTLAPPLMSAEAVKWRRSWVDPVKPDGLQAFITPHRYADTGETAIIGTFRADTAPMNAAVVKASGITA